MFSLLKRFVITIILAQWIYAEALLLAPSSQPLLDTITAYLKPPTHDKWIETYKILQAKHGESSATDDANSLSLITEELVDSVDKLSQHGGFGTIR
jgi:hypothetical protein